MNYETELKKYNIELNKEYTCNIELNGMFKESIKCTNFHFELIENDVSPMIACCFYKFDIFFADPKKVIDKYDKQAILENDDFRLLNTYDIKLLGKFIKLLRM